MIRQPGTDPFVRVVAIRRNAASDYSRGVARSPRSLVKIEATGPATFSAVAVLFLGIAVLPSWIRARRAVSLDPTVALRQN